MDLALQGHSEAEYLSALLAMLPQGPIWDAEREDAGGEVYRLCEVWAAEFADLETKLQEVIAEASPLSAEQTLDAWVAGTGTSLLEGRKPIQRARTIAAIIGSFASTEAGIKAIAQMMDYEIEFLAPDDGKTALCGSLRCGERLRGVSYKLYRELRISSERADFQVLKEKVDSQVLAYCGSLCCGERLWQSKADIQASVGVSLYEIETIESLLPAHLIVERVLV